MSNPSSGFWDAIDYEYRLHNARSFVEIYDAVSVHGMLSLSEILPRGIWLQCSDPRDRVFGILGLFKLSTKQSPPLVNLAPDYTKSVVDVYSDATRACIGECDAPWLLDLVGYEREAENTIENLPTWVPSWYCGRARFSITGIKSHALQLPNHARLWASKHWLADTPLVPGSSISRVLSIRAVLLEKVSKHSVVLTRSDPDSYFEFVSGAHNLSSNDSTHVSVNLEQLNRLDHVLGAGYKDAKVTRSLAECLRFMCSGVDPDTDDLHDPINNSTELSRLDDIQSDKPCGISQEEQDALLKEALSKFHHAARHCFGRRAFITRSGLLGIGPKALQDGDVIAVSKLSQYPTVLRRAEDSGPDHYAMIGHAFVEGIENGQEIFAAAAEGEGIGIIHLV